MNIRDVDEVVVNRRIRHPISYSKIKTLKPLRKIAATFWMPLKNSMKSQIGQGFACN